MVTLYPNIRRSVCELWSACSLTLVLFVFDIIIISKIVDISDKIIQIFISKREHEDNNHIITGQL